MGKKRNKYFIKEKELIKLQNAYNDVWKSIMNQSLVELDKPIHHGYDAEWVLREDILRRDDAMYFQEALDVCKGKIWSKNPEFKYKNSKTKQWEYVKPKMFHINKEKYDALSPQAKKLFYEDLFHNKKWRYGFTDKWYKCTLSYELVMKVTKHFITHKKEHDNILYQMKAEIDKMMNIVSQHNPWGGHRGYDKWYNRYLNRKEKLAEERKIVDVKKAYNIGDKRDLLDL